MEIGPGLVELWFGLRRRGGGVWSFLTVRMHYRTAVKLEQERTKATLLILHAIPQGIELWEGDQNGFQRVIKKLEVQKQPQLPSTGERLSNPTVHPQTGAISNHALEASPSAREAPK
ncbi:hypothetical protein [Spirillospora sp. CA-294931]|uniref:hypothetical protein n=1 Tax=Spirillospora sp. CA-294931 TaxID=3240042 RepID=UPI003D8EED73